MNTAVIPVSVHSVKDLPSQCGGRSIRGLYWIKNTVTGNLYVGSSENIARRFHAHVSRLRRNVHHSRRLQFAWKRRGEEAFEFSIIEILGGEEDILARETDLIAAILPAYNTAVVAENPMKGRKHKPESIEKMRVAMRGKKRGPRVFSEAHRQAISRSLMGRKVQKTHRLSEIQKMALSESAKKRLADPAANPAARAVMVDGVIYQTGKQAAAALGVTHKTIINRIKNGYGRYMDAPDNGNGIRVMPPGGDNLKPVIIDGEKFPSQAFAAKKFSVTGAAITYWLKIGRAQYAAG